ncbi:HPr kinase/phosphorylase [Acidocella sp.]|uniref:HPr kinase/phosphorylase n=1 Tax=Acidocella sp. TaxID=50710 RepID=UPI00260DF320|nr:hypothetical protein [Acidocella sp.]
MRLHASCAASPHGDGTNALLLLGPSGAGKSDLLLRLIERGFTLVADDQVLIEDGQARPPEALAGLLEVRGLGLFRLPFRAPARLRLVIELSTTPAPRLPAPRQHEALGLPLISLEARHPSATARAALALAAACGHTAMLSGAFAP